MTMIAKDVLLNWVEDFGVVQVSDTMICETFPAIPNTSIKELEARMVLAMKKIEVMPINDNVGKSSLHLLKEWCVKNEVELDYIAENNSYTLTKPSRDEREKNRKEWKNWLSDG